MPLTDTPKFLVEGAGFGPARFLQNRVTAGHLQPLGQPSKNLCSGGETETRTLASLAGPSRFQRAPFDRSGISP